MKQLPPAAEFTPTAKIALNTSKVVAAIALVLLTCVGIWYFVPTSQTIQKHVVLDEKSGHRWVKGQHIPDGFNSVHSINGVLAVAQGSNGRRLVTEDGGGVWKEQVLSKKLIQPDDEGIVTISFATMNSNGISHAVEITEASEEDAGNYSTIYEIQPSGVWQDILHGPIGQIYNGSANGRFLVGAKGAIIRNDSGEWKPFQVKTPKCGIPNLNAVANEADYVLAVGQNSLVLESQNAGKSWTCSPLNAGSHFLAADHRQGWSLIGGSLGIAYTRLKKGNWERIEGLNAKLSIQSIFIKDENNAFLAAGDGKSQFILSTTDRGITWKADSLPSDFQGGVTGIVALQKGIFAVSSYGFILYRQ